ncbi:MAG: zinc-binding dehydrogenase, partial [Caulobacteraceae bacterium]|nr:zinc-binding dehydrogenase [Caulobacteraceae bacterium]
ASGATFRNISVGDRASLIELVRAIGMTGLRPVIDSVFEFEDAKSAFARLESGRHFGKVVIRLV